MQLLVRGDLLQLARVTCLWLSSLAPGAGKLPKVHFWCAQCLSHPPPRAFRRSVMMRFLNFFRVFHP